MTIDQSQQKAHFSVWFKLSHRSLAEQAVGAAIFLIVSFAFEWLTGWLIFRSTGSEWIRQTISSVGAFSAIASYPLWILYHLLTASALWVLWRRYSLKVLKLELSVFLFQLFLQGGWALSFFLWNAPLPALAALLFLCSNTILSALLYWKKERLAGQLLLPPFLWIFFVMGVNMAICISNP